MRDKVILGVCVSFVVSACQPIDDDSNYKRPNIIIILADDMGYSDLGCYGGEINTPNLDQLASKGIRFTQFYNAARCCPTRASLLTGLYPHQAGMGAMIRDPEMSEPGPYQGYLSKNSVTIAEVLRDAGYFTAISGKWHVGEIRPHWPVDRGFDSFFGLIGGAANYFDIHKGRSKNKPTLHIIDTLPYEQPENFYMTEAITDHGIQFIKMAGEKDKPFFLFLSYTAPHWPLHARQEDIDRYRGKYMEGWNKLKTARYQKMRNSGFPFHENLDINNDPELPEWNSLNREEQEKMDLLMAIYAAQVDLMDQGIGKVMDYLDSNGLKDNTLVLFLSDNGGCAEYDVMGTDMWGNFWDQNVRQGSGETFHTIGQAWANLSNTPFRLYKKNAHEGGIATPLIVSWPERITNPGSISDHTGHVFDIMSTCIEAAQTEYPENRNGIEITPTPGISFLGVLKKEQVEVHEYLFWEHIGHKAVRAGNWKLVAEKGKGWELFDLENDRQESMNLIMKFPEIKNELEEKYNQWAKKTGVK